LIKENEQLFGNAYKTNSESEGLETLILILSKINYIDGQILFVIDNAEDIICNDKTKFKDIL